MAGPLIGDDVQLVAARGKSNFSLLSVYECPRHNLKMMPNVPQISNDKFLHSSTKDVWFTRERGGEEGKGIGPYIISNFFVMKRVFISGCVSYILLNFVPTVPFMCNLFQM